MKYLAAFLLLFNLALVSLGNGQTANTYQYQQYFEGQLTKGRTTPPVKTTATFTATFDTKSTATVTPTATFTATPTK